MKTREDLEKLKYKLGFLQEVDCSSEETDEYRKLLNQGMPLPDGVLRKNPFEANDFAVFYTIKETDLSGEELAQYIQYQQLQSLITIKRCVVFFTVLTIISLACGAIGVLSFLFI